MAEWAPRRFWTEVTVEPADGGHAVLLDGRPVRTPARGRLVVPTRAFAEAVAEEWRAQGATLDPRAMPATRLANAAIDKVAGGRGAVVDALARFGASDLLCYRAERPEALARRQRAAWDPLLAWSAEAIGADLAVGSGVMPVAQPPADLARLRDRVAAFDDFRLAAFHDLVALTGSLVLGLAVAAGRLAPEEAWRLSRLDEDYQAEEWGQDEEAAEAARARRAAFMDAARFLALLAPDAP